MRRHLEAGVEPTLKGRRAVLKDVVLVKANGRETPVVEEARRLVPNIDLSYWSGETERQRHRVFLHSIAKATGTRSRKGGQASKWPRRQGAGSTKRHHRRNGSSTRPWSTCEADKIPTNATLT